MSPQWYRALINREEASAFPLIRNLRSQFASFSGTNVFLTLSNQWFFHRNGELSRLAAIESVYDDSRDRLFLYGNKLGTPFVPVGLLVMRGKRLLQTFPFEVRENVDFKEGQSGRGSLKWSGQTLTMRDDRNTLWQASPDAYLFFLNRRERFISNAFDQVSRSLADTNQVNLLLQWQERRRFFIQSEFDFAKLIQSGFDPTLDQMYEYSERTGPHSFDHGISIYRKNRLWAKCPTGSSLYRLNSDQ